MNDRSITREIFQIVLLTMFLPLVAIMTLFYSNYTYEKSISERQLDESKNKINSIIEFEIKHIQSELNSFFYSSKSIEYLLTPEKFRPYIETSLYTKFQNIGYLKKLKPTINIFDNKERKIKNNFLKLSDNSLSLLKSAGDELVFIEKIVVDDNNNKIITGTFLGYGEVKIKFNKVLKKLNLETEISNIKIKDNKIIIKWENQWNKNKDIGVVKFITTFSLLLIIMIFGIVLLRRRIVEPILNISEFINNKNIGIIARESTNELTKLKYSFEAYIKSNVLLREELIEKSKKEVIFEHARKVAHDIRSPLSALMSALSGLKIENKNEKYVIQGAINRINEISNNLLKLGKKSINKTVDLNQILEQIIEEKKYEFPKLEIEFVKCDAGYITANEQDLLRALSNLLNNSIESNEKNPVVSVLMELANNEVKLIITDNGKGIEKGIHNKIFDKNFTTKKSGSGLGLYQVKEAVESSGGKISLDKNYTTGARFIISFPVAQSENNIGNEIILIDNDKYVRKSWEMSAEKKSIKIYTFSDVEEFKLVAEKFDKGIYIFVDSELDNGQKGEILAEEIFNLGFENILLATGKLPEEFDLKLYPWIKGIQSKEFPI